MKRARSPYYKLIQTLSEEAQKRNKVKDAWRASPAGIQARLDALTDEEQDGLMSIWKVGP